MTCTACGTAVPPGVAECLGCGRAVPVLSSTSKVGAGGAGMSGPAFGSLPPPGNASFGGTPFGDQQFTRLEDTSFGDLFFDGAGFGSAALASPVTTTPASGAVGRPATDRGTRLALVAVLTVLVALVTAGLVWFFANVGDTTQQGINAAGRTGWAGQTLRHAVQESTAAQGRPHASTVTEVSVRGG